MSQPKEPKSKKHPLQKGTYPRVKICLTITPRTAENIKKSSTMLGYSQGEVVDMMMRQMMVGRYHIGASLSKYPVRSERETVLAAWKKWQSSTNEAARFAAKQKAKAEAEAKAKEAAPAPQPEKPATPAPTGPLAGIKIPKSKTPTKFST